MRVAVVGGGISGLVAARDLCRSPAGVDVTLIEADDRLGGKILTTPFAGAPVDAGPDAFLARVPEAVELCAELGLAEELVAPATGSAYVWSRGALRRLPAGLVLGVPTDLDALRASGIVSPAAVDLAAADLDRPAAKPHRGRPAGDESVGALVRRRLGDEVLERLVDPLLGGINAGDADRLSLAAAAPRLAEAAAGGASLVAALRATARLEKAIAGPLFLTHPAGLGLLVDRLANDLADADVRLGTAVCSLVPMAGRGYRLELIGAGAGAVEADAVIVATPAPVSAALLGWCPEAAAVLAAIEYASVVLVTVAVPDEAVGRALDASGFLVPRTEGLLMTACSWASAKWAHLARPGTAVLRVSAGRRGDDRARRLDDRELVDRLLAELGVTMGLDRRPTAVRVSPWPASFPQYDPGHLDRVAAAERALAEAAPGVVLAGAAFRGVGLPACIRSARAAAEKVVAGVQLQG